MSLIWQSIQKVALLGGYGAVGGLIGAISGQILLAIAIGSPSGVAALPTAKQKVDVIFVIDVTASMSDEISGVRRGIRGFVDTLRTAELDSEVGLIAFRDLERNEPAEVISINGQTLTKDIDAFSYAISSLVANGGGDEPESSIEALVLAAEQPFRSGAAKVLILITDAPPKISDPNSLTVVEGVRRLREHKIDQLHLVVQEGDLPAFAKFHASIPGRYFSLAESASERKNFQKLLDAVADQLVREIRIASPLDSKQEVGASEITLLITRTAIWTAALAAGVFLSLAIGQSRYLGRLLPPLGRTSVGLAGCICAGLGAGTLGALSAVMVSQTIGLFPNWLAKMVPSALLGRSLAWALLGGALGFGMSYFVPNLKRIRSTIGGVAGGICAVFIFLSAAPHVGDKIGLLIGGTVVGCVIGLMVAVIEAAFREAWLEVSYGREIRTVSLGAIPVSIGSDRKQSTIYARDSLPVAFRYRIVEQMIESEDVASHRFEMVADGHQRIVGNATVCVRTSAGDVKVKSPVSKTENGIFKLTLSNGPSIQLVVGSRLFASDLLGLHSSSNDGVVAEVITNPNNPAALGLKNLSQECWKATVAAGVEKLIDPGRSIQLSIGTRIKFGELTGVIG